MKANVPVSYQALLHVITALFLAIAIPAVNADEKNKEPQPAAPGYHPVLEIELAGHKAALILPTDTEKFPGDIPLVVFSDGAGSRGYGRRNAILMAKAFAKMPLQPAILTSSYNNHLSPGADGGRGLLEAVDAAAEEYGTSRGFFLTGFSRGAQFAHRFVFHAAPERVFAAAPCNAGGYTLPQGGTLVQAKYGGNNPMGTPRPESARKSWSLEEWEAHLLPAADKARQVPFLVFCSENDSSRLPLAKDFAKALTAAGWKHVETSFDQPGGHRFHEDTSATTVADFFSRIMLAAMETEDKED